MSVQYAFGKTQALRFDALGGPGNPPGLQRSYGKSCR